MKEKIIAIGLLIAAGITALVLWLKREEPSPEPPLPDVSCEVDSDCPAGYYCKGGQCYEIPEPPPEGYQIELSKLEISSPAFIGIPTPISCKASLCVSPRGQPITRTVTLFVNGVGVQSVEVTLIRTFLCATTTISFEFIPQTLGSFSVEVDGLGGSLEVVAEVFENTLPELVKSATEFADEMAEAYGDKAIELAMPFIHSTSNLKETCFTFDPAGKHANFNCIVDLDLRAYSGWNLGATLIAVKASEYQNWLTNIKFIKWGHPGRLGVGVYGLGFPLEQAGLIPLDSQGYPSRASICGRGYACEYVHYEETHGGWQGCNLRSGEHEFNFGGPLNLEHGSWIVLASFVLSICNIYTGYDGRKVVLPLDCYNYRIYRIGEINF